MTFLQLQDRVMGRLNLTTTTARSRIKEFLNERYRELATSLGLPLVRRGTADVTTTSGQSTLAVTTVVKPIVITYAAGNRVLRERTIEQIREMDPAMSTSGEPEVYALVKFSATGFTLHIWPKPDAVYTLGIDGILPGTDMTEDGDIPAFPEDFHNTLIYGALADELDHMKDADASQKAEGKYERRLSELRYFLAKSAYLHRNTGPTLFGEWWRLPWV